MADFEILEKPRVLPVTRELARRFANMPGVPDDRPLSEARKKIITGYVVNGNVRPFNWSSVLIESTGQEFRADGKHSSNAIVDLENIPDGMFAVVTKYKTPEPVGAACLYSTFDCRESVKSVHQVNSPFLNAAGLSHIPGDIGDTIIAGMSYWLHGEHYATYELARIRAERVAEEKNKQFAEMVGLILAGKQARRKLKRAPVVAVMYGGWLNNPDDALDFWIHVRDENGLTPRCPDRYLARWLDTILVDHGNGVANATRERKTVSLREVYCRCVLNWNAWCRGKDAVVKYYLDGQLPELAPGRKKQKVSS